MNSFTPIEVAIDELAERQAELAELHAELENYKEFAVQCCDLACSCYDNFLIDIADKQTKYDALSLEIQTQLDALLLEIQLASKSLEQL